MDFPQCRFVTIAMDDVQFHHSVREGTILSIDSTMLRKGNTSVTYRVQVVDTRNPQANPLFATTVTFVNVTEAGEKSPIDAA
jgi:acyl-CoA hydrolase